MACVDSRPHELGGVPVRLRKYVSEMGVLSTTIEVPTDLWNQIVLRCGKEAFIVTPKASIDTGKRDRVLKLLDAGWKPIAIAMEVGVGETTVRKYNRERNGK